MKCKKKVFVYRNEVDEYIVQIIDNLDVQMEPYGTYGKASHRATQLKKEGYKRI